MAHKLFLAFVLLGFAAFAVAEQSPGLPGDAVAELRVAAGRLLTTDASRAREPRAPSAAQRPARGTARVAHAKPGPSAAAPLSRLLDRLVGPPRAVAGPSGVAPARATAAAGSAFTLAAAAGEPEADALAPAPSGVSLLSASAGDPDHFAACATGTVRGFGFDAGTGKYRATCGNYNWSAESGGAADYDSATTPGGNGEYITCVDVDEAVSDLGGTYDDTILASGICGEGSTTSLCKLAATSLPANRFRDRVIRVEIGGEAQYRRIASDVDDGLDHDFIVTGDKPFTASPVGLAFIVQDDIGTLCAGPGERIKLNYMADAMLAQDHTVPGGHVYFPNFEGYDHAIYVQRGCGRKGTVAVGTSSNDCPVLAPPLDEHFQRSLQAFRRVNWISQGTDPDGWENGRKNVWHIDDFGGARSINQGFDPNDGITANSNWTFKSGLGSILARRCVPTSTTDPDCDPTASQNTEAGDSSWGRVFQWVNTSQMTDESALCVSTSLPESGTCRGDRRIACTANGPRTSQVSGGCDFGAGGDLGPCESARDAIEHEVETLGRPLKVLSQWNLYEFPETDVQQVTATADFFTVVDVPGSAGSPTECGAGAAISTVGPGNTGGGWPFGKSKLEADDLLKDFVVLDWERYFNEGGGWTQGTFSPNQWYGRDIDGDGVSGRGDCLSAGDPDSDDDETFCDFSPLLGLHSSYRGGFEGIVVTNGSGSSVDGAVSGISVRLYDSLIINGKRGTGGDASDWDIRHNTWMNNTCTLGCLNVNFTHSAILTDQRFIGNSGTPVLGTNHGKGAMIDNLFFEGNRGVLIALDHASDMTISNVIAYGNSGALLVAFPRHPLNNFTLTKVHAYGRGNWGRTGAYGDALISFGRLGSKTGFNETIRNFTFRDIHFESPENDLCLFYFDDAQGSDDPTISVNRTQFSISDASIDGLNGATGHKALCVAPIGADVTNGISSPNATDDLGIERQRYQPIWRNVRANGVPLPDQPLPMVAAANAGDCNALSQGTLTRIFDDTAIGACRDAGANGVLDGGGTAVSTCVCDGLGEWKTSGAADVVSTGPSVAGGIPSFSDTSGDRVVDSGARIVDGVLTLAASTARPSEVRYLEDADFGSSYFATQAVSNGTNLIGDVRLILSRVARALAAASGARGPVVGAVSNGGSFDTPEGLCDLSYYAANGVVQTCISGTAKRFDPLTGVPSWIGCGDEVPNGTYFEVVCNVE